MNPKVPNKELELKKKKRWLKSEEEQDPWRGVTDLLSTIDPVNLPSDYDFKALHDKVMTAVSETHPNWAQKKRS